MTNEEAKPEVKEVRIDILELVRDNGNNSAVLEALKIVRRAEETCVNEGITVPWPMAQIWLDISKLYRK